MTFEKALKTAVAAFLFCAAAAAAGVGFCDDADTHVEQGKTLLLDVPDSDIYGADAEFAAALAHDPNNAKANFWKAITTISQNPQLKQALTDMEIFSPNPENDFLIFDKEGKSQYGYSHVETIILDNTDAGYSETGSGWNTVSSGLDTYDADCRAHAAGAGANVAVWTPTITMPGWYTVCAWYGYSPDNATNAKFTVYYDGGSVTRERNQKGESDRWVRLGTFRFTPGQPARIELSDDANGQVVADAVRLMYDIYYLSETEANLTGSWQTVDGGSHNPPYPSTHLEISAGTGGTCVWTPNIPAAGKYVLDAQWYTCGEEGATDAVYEVRVNNILIDSIEVDQQHGAGGGTNLGLYDLPSGANTTITLLQSATGKVTTDGVGLTLSRPNPDFTDSQAIFNSALTQVNEAIEYLDNIVSSAFQDTADLWMDDANGAPILTEIDYGDVLMLKAWLYLLKERIYLFGSMNMDNLDPYEVLVTYFSGPPPVSYFLDTYPNLGKGLDYTHSSAAKQAAIEGLNAYFDAYDFIMDETDSQDDDLITFNSPQSQDATSILNPKLQQLLNNLQAATNPPLLTISSDDVPDTGNKYFKFVLNPSAMYAYHEPGGLRAFLPQFGSDNMPIRGTWPDPTFGGYMPDMTSADLNGWAGLGSYLHTAKVSWTGGAPSVLLNWEKDTYADFMSYKIYRSLTGDVGENADGTLKPGTSLIYATTDVNMLSCNDATLDPAERIYYYRLYTYYTTNNEKAASAVRKVITKIYVNIANTSGTEDGSPEHPYKLLRDAVDNATDGVKICVAQGTYGESSETMHLWGADTIVLEGGYNSSNWSRDITGNPTIIDGQGSGSSGTAMIGIYNLSGFILDGFTVKNTGNRGVGISQSHDITIKNCIFMDNAQEAIEVWEGSTGVVISNCTFNNSANQRGGIHAGNNSSGSISDSMFIGDDNNDAGIRMEDSSFTIYGCLVQHNGNPTSGWDGIYIRGNSNVTIIDTQIYNNAKQGVNVADGATVAVEHCAIKGSGEHGIHVDNNSVINVRNSDISENTLNGIRILNASSEGPAMEIRNCTIVNNYASGPGRDSITLQDTYDRVTVKNNLIIGKGIGCDGNDSPVIINNTLAGTATWGLVWSSGTTGHNVAPAIRNNIITGKAVGIHFENGTGSPNIDYNVVWGNTANYSGCSAGLNDITADPKFVGGPSYSNYYLSQTSSWQIINSPCINAGDPNIPVLDFTGFTTKTNGGPDTDIVDIGYHFPVPLVPSNLSAVVINEFLPNPTGDDTGKEWVELYNRSNEAIDIGGCVIDDAVMLGSDPVTIPQGTVIQPHGFYSMTMPGSNYFTNTGGGSPSTSFATLLWPTQGGTVISVIDSYEYPTPTEGASFYRYSDGESWAANVDDTPTKDAANDGPSATQSELIIDFGSSGVWVRNADASWSNLHGLNPEQAVAADLDADNKEDIIADFGEGYGVWVRYSTTEVWSHLHGLSPQNMLTADINADSQKEIIFDFGAQGIWIRYVNGDWSNIHGWDPEGIVAGDINGDNTNELIFDFGSNGIWTRNSDGSMSNIHGWNPEGIVAGDINGDNTDELVFDFGAQGIWIRYANGDWSNIHGWDPENTIAADINGDNTDELVFDFGAQGIWTRNSDGAMSNIHGWDPEAIAAGNIEA